MPRRGNCCRCIGSCTSNFIFRDRQHPLTSVFSQTGASRSPLPDQDERGLPTRWFIPRAWLEYVVGTTRQPRGGSLLVDLQATGISVGATVIPLLDRPTSEVVRDFINGIRYYQGVTLTQSELTQQMYVSLFGDGVQAGSALRLTATGQTSPLYFANNTNVVMVRVIPRGDVLTVSYQPPSEAIVEACVTQRTAGAKASFDAAYEAYQNGQITATQFDAIKEAYFNGVAGARQLCINDNMTPVYGRLQNAQGGGPLGFDDWQRAEYGNVLPIGLERTARYYQGYVPYFRSIVAAQDKTQLSPRLAVSLGGATRLVQPQSGRFIGQTDGGGNSIEILTASPAEGVIVATARPQGMPDFPFGWGDPSPPSLIWPEPLWKPLFSRLPLLGLGGSAYRAVIYRDGESVATVVRTPPSAPSNWTGPFAEHTNEEGSYFLSFDSNAGLLQGFLSFVIDRTPPMGCFEQVNDFFEGDPTNASGFSYSDGVGTVRRFTTETTRTLANDGRWESASFTRSEFSKSLEPGTYTLEYPGQYFDHVGNPMPTPLPTAQFQVHEIPSEEKYGAQATLSLPPNDDSLVYDSPVPSITVTFSRQVSLLRKSMFTVTGRKDDGSTVDLPFTLSGDGGEISGNATGGGTTFALALDTDPEKQGYNTSWLVVFDPRSGGQVFADAGSQPPEPCVLRSRCSWLIRQDQTPGRELIDTGSSAVTLNRIPTLTATLSESSLPAAPGRHDSLIDLSADTILPVNYVNDAALPIGCYEQVSDFFEGDPTNASGVAYNEAGEGEVRRVASEKVYADPAGDNTPPDWVGTSTFSRFLSASADPYTLSNNGVFRGLDGDPMPGPPTAQFRVRAIPTNGKLGAHAWISIEGDSPANKGPLSRGPVPSLSITFNRHVEGLRRSMISVSGTLANGTAATLSFRLFAVNGQLSTEIVDNEPGEGTVFRVDFDSLPAQAAGSAWLFTLTPASGLEVPAVGDIPAETCVLAARRSWLIPQGEDLYGGVSPTATYLYGQSSPFVPQVPPALSTPTDVPYSYFGLSTTLYPSAPKALPCPAPGASQPHSSLILGGGGITSLTVRLVPQPQGNAPAWSSLSFRMRALGWAFFELDRSDGSSGQDAPWHTKPLTFSAALNGEQCSQNVWVHSSTGGSTFQHVPHTEWEINTNLRFATNLNNVKLLGYAEGGSVSVESTAATLIVGRTAATYASLNTSTLGQLTLLLNVNTSAAGSRYRGYPTRTPTRWRACDPFPNAMGSTLYAEANPVPGGQYAACYMDKSWPPSGDEVALINSFNPSVHARGPLGPTNPYENGSFKNGPAAPSRRNGISWQSADYQNPNSGSPLEDIDGSVIEGNFLTRPTGGGGTLSQTLTLTRQQEEQLASGQTILVRGQGSTVIGGFWDANGSTGTYDHFWEISAS
jgi:hypothetical protein